MADFYHDNLTNHYYLMSLNNDVDPSLAPQSPSSYIDELNCFNATELAAVPSFAGKLLLIILYSLTSFLALIGNVTVIVVEICGKESAHNIRKYLINLAISDIIIGVLCVPFTYTDFMLGQWIFPHWLCPTAQFVQLLSVFVTSLTLTFIGIERYMATLHPFSSLHHWLECHTHIMLALTWVFGAAYAYIPFENTATRSFTLPTDNQTYYECSYDNGVSMLKRRLFMSSNFILTFILPLLVLIFSYSAIMRKLIHDERKFRKSSKLSYGIKFKTTTTAPSSSSGSAQESSSVPAASANVTNGSGNVQPISNGKPTITLNSNNGDNKGLGTETPETPVHQDDVINNNYYPGLSNATNHKTEIEPAKMTKITKTTHSANSTISPSPSSTPPSISGHHHHQQPQSKNQVSSSNFDLRKSTPFNYRSKTIKMMFTVILLYGICWMPIKLYQFLNDFGMIGYCTERELYAMVCLYFICHWMAMANSFVNPIIYSFMSKSFRNDFRKISQTFRQTFSKNKYNNNNQLSIKTASTQV